MPYRKDSPRDCTVLDACDVIAAAEEAKRHLRVAYRDLTVVQQRARAINQRLDGTQAQIEAA